MLNDHPLNAPFLFAPQPDLLACGLPSPQDLEDAAKKGVKTVINLCPLEETPPEEPGLVESLGMQYANIPIRGPMDLTREAASQLAALLNDGDRQPILVHCRSANRVGALMALKAHWLDGMSPQEAIDLGRAAGLTKLEPAVLAILSA